MELAIARTTVPDALAQGYVFVKASSYRARGRLPTSGAQSYYSLRRNTRYGVYAVKPVSSLPRGITYLRGPFDDLGMCWN